MPHAPRGELSMCRESSCAQLGLRTAAAETLSVDVRMSASPPKNCRLFYAVLSRRTELRLLVRWRWHVLSCLVHLVLPQATLEAMDSSSWSLTHHTHYTHTPHTHTSCTHLHGHSHTTHSLRRSHTTHTNATKRILQTALWEAARTHLLTPTYALTRALTHSLTHTLTCSFTHSLLFTSALVTNR